VPRPTRRICFVRCQIVADRGISEIFLTTNLQPLILSAHYQKIRESYCVNAGHRLAD
jgi:hypothetical protein